MRILLDEPCVDMSYCTVTITTHEDADTSDYDAPWVDESNGLCGAGDPGRLELVTGTHTGGVPFRLELHEFEPAIDLKWEEVVEVSFTTHADEAFLTGLMGDQFRFELPRGEYRVRYCAQGFDEAHARDDATDSYLVQFWPGPSAPGSILVQTGAHAAYWHRSRRTLTAEEQREDELREAAEREMQARRRWGSRVPNDRLRATLGAGLHSGAMSKLDIDLEFALAEVDDALQRQVATWAAVKCLELSGLSILPEVKPAMLALRRGDMPPPPFDDPTYCWGILERAQLKRTVVPVPPDGDGTQSPQDWAITTLFHATADDSLVSVLEILVCLACVHGRDGFREALAEVRARFPSL